MSNQTNQMQPFDLRSRLEEWVAAGVIDRSVATAVMDYEHLDGSVAPLLPRRRRLSLVAELISYLGIVLVIASGAFLIARIWHTLGVSGQSLVGVAIALIGFLGGTALARFEEEGTDRLSWLFWLVGTAGLSMTAAVLVDRGAHSSGWTVLSAGLVAAMASAAIWRNRELPVQFASLVAGLVMIVVGATQVAHLNPSSFVVGVVVWTAALALAVVSEMGLRPSIEAKLIASFGVVAGSTAMADLHPAIGVLIGLVSASAVIAWGIVEGLPILTVVGVLGFFEFVLRFLSLYLHGVGAVLGAFLLGAGLIVAVLWRGSHPRGSNRAHHWPWHHGSPGH